MFEEFLVSERQADGMRKYPTVPFSPRSSRFLIFREYGRGRDADRSWQFYGNAIR